LTSAADSVNTSAMTRYTRLLLTLACALVLLAGNRSRADVVVAIRYLQPKGTSHSHLYLYADGGKLLRQLTKDDSGQDFDPIFAPDGKTIVFSREKKDDVVETWSIKPDGSGLKQLERPPEWYAATKSSPYFTNFEPEPAAEAEPPASPEPSPAAAEEDPPRTFRAPDDSVEVVARRLADDEDDSANSERTGKHFLLRDLKAGTEVEMGTLPGFVGLWDVLQLRGTDTAFLFEGALRTIFFGLHLNSTDGDTVFALDLPRARLVRLSPNWAAPIPLPGEPAFVTYTYNRYVPIPGSKMTANCTYFERWDASLNKVRYAREGTAAICYGASVFRPGRTPATVNVRRDGN
jgi:hypothetical protein